MEQESKQTLDLENIEKEKQILTRLIRPAIEQFVINTRGAIPNINVSKFQTSMETKCGTMWSEGEVNISVSVTI